MKKVFIRVISVMCVLAMLIPLSSCSILKSDTEVRRIWSLNPAAYGMLGQTFNALSDEEMSPEKLKTAYVFNSRKLAAYRLGDTKSGVIKQESDVYFEKSAKEMMVKLGVDVDLSTGADFSIDVLKLGFAKKFGLGIDYQTAEKTEEAFYYYAYHAICENYSIDSKKDYSKMADKEFLKAVSTLDYSRPERIKEFFEKFGTHALTKYDKGAEMILTAAAVSTSNDINLEVDFLAGVSATADFAELGVPLSASNSKEIQLAFSNCDSRDNVTAKTTWQTIGGDSTFCAKFTEASIVLDDESVKAWVDSVSGENGNSVFLPETSEWVAIWDILPETPEYAEVKKALYDYYMSEASSKNTEFFSRFGTYSELVEVPAYTYVSPNGRVSNLTSVSLEEGYFPVAPGSSIAVPAESEGYDISYDIFEGKKYAEIDTHGNINIKSSAVIGEKIAVKINLDGLPASTVRLIVKKEGAGHVFKDGGYGTSERPYLVSNKEDFLAVPSYGKSSFLLTASIYCGGAEWKSAPFYGVFDGGGYTVSDLKISNKQNKVGLFSELIGGTVKNLNVQSCVINIGEWWTDTEENHLGVIAGFVDDNSEITNCSVSNGDLYAQIKRNEKIQLRMGGIAGTSQGKISFCSVKNTKIHGQARGNENGRKDCDTYFGGIAGKVQHSGAKILNCAAYDNTIISYIYTVGYERYDAYARAIIYLGGVAGELYSGAKVENSIYYHNSISYDREYKEHSGLNIWDDDEKYNPTDVSTGRCIGKEQEENMTLGNLELASKPEVIRTVVAITVDAEKLQYQVGDIIDASTLTVTGTYDDSSTAGEINNYIISGFDTSSAGEKTITVTYTYNGTTLTDTFDVEVVEKP